MISAAKWGALIGAGSYVILIIGLALISSMLFGTSPADFNHPGPLTLACLGIFGILFAFSAAGYFTGRETHKAGWGAISAISGSFHTRITIAGYPQKAGRQNILTLEGRRRSIT